MAGLEVVWALLVLVRISYQTVEVAASEAYV